MHTIVGFVSYGFNEKDGFDNAVEIAEEIWNRYQEAEKKAGSDMNIGPPLFDGCTFFDRDQTKVGGEIFSALEMISKMISEKANVVVDPRGWGEERYGKFSAVMRADSEEAEKFIESVIEANEKESSDDEYWWRGFIGKDGHIDNMKDLRKVLVPSRPHFNTFIIPADIHF